MGDNEYVKYKFAKAIRRLMQTKAIEKITVKEITEESGLSRQTYYRNFFDKYDLINWYFDKILLKSFDQMGSGKTIYSGLVLKFQYICEEKVFFTVAFKNDDQNNLKEHDFNMILEFYKNLIREKSGGKSYEEIYPLLEMYCQSSVYMTVKWVLNGTKLSPEELAIVMIDAMPPRLSKLFEELGLMK